MSTDKGRDSMAVGDAESTLFIMPTREINKINDSFDGIYHEMLEIALKRHKNHQILISNAVKQYLDRVKEDTFSRSSSDMDSDIDDEDPLGEQNPSELLEQPQNVIRSRSACSEESFS